MAMPRRWQNSVWPGPQRVRGRGLTHRGVKRRRDASRACREIKKTRFAAYDRFLERHVQKLKEVLHRNNQWGVHR